RERERVVDRDGGLGMPRDRDERDRRRARVDRLGDANEPALEAELQPGRERVEPARDDCNADRETPGAWVGATADVAAERAPEWDVDSDLDAWAPGRGLGGRGSGAPELDADGRRLAARQREHALVANEALVGGLHAVLAAGQLPFPRPAPERDAI